MFILGYPEFMFLMLVKKYRIELFVFFLAFLIRFFYASALQYKFGSHVFISFSDAETYLRMGYNILHYHTLSQVATLPFLLPDPLRTPFYPLFLAFFVCLKIPTLFIAAAQDALVGLMAVMTYRLGLRIFESRWVGIFAAIVLGLEPMLIYWNNLLTSDTLASFLFLLAIYLFVFKKYYTSFFVIGLAALTRPTFLYLSSIFFLMFFYEYWHELFNKTILKINSFIYWKKFLIMILILFFSVFPWMLRNKINFNNWGFSSNGWFAMYYFNAEKFASLKKEPYSFPPVAIDPDFHPDIPERYYTYYYEFSVVPQYKNYLFYLISKYPIDYFKFHFVSSVIGFQNHDYKYIMDFVVRAKIPEFPQTIGNLLIRMGQNIWIIIYLFVILGFFFKEKRKYQFFLLSFYLLNNFLTGYISTVSAGGRYNMPFLPLILLLAAYGGACSYKYVFKLYKRHFIIINKGGSE